MNWFNSNVSNHVYFSSMPFGVNHLLKKRSMRDDKLLARAMSSSAPFRNKSNSRFFSYVSTLDFLMSLCFGIFRPSSNKTEEHAITSLFTADRIQRNVANNSITARSKGENRQPEKRQRSVCIQAQCNLHYLTFCWKRVIAVTLCRLNRPPPLFKYNLNRIKYYMEITHNLDTLIRLFVKIFSIDDVYQSNLFLPPLTRSVHLQSLHWKSFEQLFLKMFFFSVHEISHLRNVWSWRFQFPGLVFILAPCTAGGEVFLLLLLLLFFLNGVNSFVVLKKCDTKIVVDQNQTCLPSKRRSSGKS